MRKFDYSFLKTLLVPTSFLSLTNAIYALKNEEINKKIDYPDLFEKLQRIAIVQSVKGSNAIEGIVTTDKRIEEIVHQNSAPQNHNEQEISGYRDALHLVQTQYSQIPFNERTILNLHNTLLNHTDFGSKGEYKKEDNVIRERFVDGTTRIRWTPVSAIETKEAMDQLFSAFMDARDDSSINQALLIPCVILDFLCIHPFQDGNGRMSRLLSLLLLYKNDFDISKYISFEEQINNSKGEYYEALKRSSARWHENQNDYVPFVENFLMTLFRCYKELGKRFLTLHSGRVSKKQRIEEIVLNAFIPISKKEIFDLLPDISITTIEGVLSAMLKDSRITKIGNTKKSRYIKK